MSPSSNNHPEAQSRRRIRQSSFYRHVVGLPASQEWDSWKLFLRREWHWVLLVLFGLLVLVLWVRPLPPAQVTLAVGPQNSALAHLGERYVSAFEQAGIELKLVYSDQAGLASALAAQEGDQIDAAFLIAGLARSNDIPDLVSLGSVDYAPIWVFYRGEVEPGLDFFQAFAKPSMRIGFAGPVSQALIENIASKRAVAINTDNGFEAVASRHQVGRFVAGELDVVVIVDGHDSAYVQQLVAAPGAKLFDMGLAQAYARHFAYLEALTVVRGALDLVSIAPAKDTTVLTSTVSLLVDQSLHPTVQQLFLTVTNRLDGLTGSFFDRSGLLPAYLDTNVALSPVARRFYAEGGIALEQRLPYWLASLIDRLWLLVLGLIAVLYPLYRLIPRYRIIRSELQIADAYEVLRHIDDLAAQHHEPKATASYLGDLDALEAHLHQSWIASESMDAFYHLRAAISQLRARLQDRL